MHAIRMTVRRARLLACTTAAAVLLASITPVGAQPATPSDERTPSGTPFVTVTKNAPSTAVDGAFAITATVAVDRPTSYLEARIQIRNPGGRLLYQKTEIRHEVTTGTVSFGYQRELNDLDLTPGVYPLELRVRSDSAGEVREWLVEDRLLLYDPEGETVPFALVARVSSAPSYDSEGRFVIDPGTSDAARRHVDELTALVLGEPRLHLSLAVPPFLTEEWARIASGYETSGPEGVQQVGADEEVPQRYAETLTRLDAALESGRLELLTVGYADPDLTGLARSGRLADLQDHYARGLSATLASLDASPTPGAAFSGDLVPAAAVQQLAERGIDYFVVSPESLAAAESTPTSGPYLAGADSGPRALLLDAALTEALAAGDTACVTDRLFERVVSETGATPVIAVLELGPGRDGAVDALGECLDDLGATPWLEFARAGDAARAEPAGNLELKDDPVAGAQAPADYWTEVAQARALSRGYLDAVGVNDPDAQIANDASLIAQSRTWAGPDGSWSSAGRGLGFAAAATRSASAVLDAVSVSAQDITLSSAQGDVPVTIDNGSEKTLLLRLVVSASGMALPDPPEPVVTARPQENFLTVPVDLQSSLSGRMCVRVYAGDVLVDEAVVAVRASYLDRLAIVGGIAAVLVGLLLFIRRRIRRAAATIDTG